MRRLPIRENAFWQTYGRARYAILFYALLLTLIFMPAATTIGMPAVLIKLMLAASLLAAVLPNAGPRSRFLLFAAIGALFLAQLASSYGYLPLNSGLVLTLGGLIGLLAADGTLRFTIRYNIVDG